MTAPKEKLVVVGNGMAGIGTLEQILKLTDRFDVTVFGSEPYPNYNRIQLSYVLEGSKKVEDIILNPLEWYEENGIELYIGTVVERIDTNRKVVLTEQGEAFHYDHLILATGSKPFILPIPGAELDGVVGFRDIQDCEKMREAARTVRKAAVIGGGLLGLEAAKGLVQLGMEVTVVHLMDKLMERQLDGRAARMLKEELERQGIAFMLETQTKELVGDTRVTGLKFADGHVLEAELVVMAVGIAPNIDIARKSGLMVNRGIVVDDVMRTSEPNIYAVGECCEHREICYGLVAPLFEQGGVLAKHLAGLNPEPYKGSTVSTKLKISGVDVFSAGQFIESEEHQVLTVQDDWKGTYKKVLLKDRKVVGAVLFGDVTDAMVLDKWVKNASEMTQDMYDSIFDGGTCCSGDKKAGLSVEAMDDSEIVCGCNGVTKGTIVEVIQANSFTTVEEIKKCTGATRSCGGCKPMVEQILAYVLGDEFEGGSAKETICACTDCTRDEVVEAIREKKLTHVKEVMIVLGWINPEGCSKCRPAINYYLGMVWPKEHEDELESRFVNERLHANIQKDGTFSVVPRMYGGVTTPGELKKIAEIAEKYEVPMVKVTGGQRIDLLGIKKEDLPSVWAELDMPSGAAYAKGLRTVKTCVGNRFCRFGTQDSIGMGITMEKKYEGLYMPAKFKMAVNGCPRNCAESSNKDLGIVGNDGGWEIYVGGNGGIKARIADLFCKVKSDEELLEICSAFIQYYRENGKYLERTSDWIERVGLETVQKAVIEDKAQRKALVERLEIAISRHRDPWQEAIHNGSLRMNLYEPIEVTLQS
ncbi:nitrite reductase large subunit NirB [Marinicrinis lubricantis]|uniref:Nitrite reductase large subunit NirB n=1 Tax=Marinicrinis lubricantis TaxID=2086470 RepID=A0ABW1IK57_9BACL